MPTTDVTRLRRKLGENIPAGGSDADTMFTNVEVQALLDDSGSDVTKAALEGWRAKAAEYSNLVNVSEGNSQRQMSDLHKHALTMIDYYTKEVDKLEETDDFEGRTGRVIIGEISRAKRYR